MNALRWTEAQLRGYQARAGEAAGASRATRYLWVGPPGTAAPRPAAAVQLPLGRGVSGLDRPGRINVSAQEWQEAERLIRWTDEEGARLYPELAYFYAIPNGGFRHKAVAGRMKAQGVRAGVLDFNLDVARGNYHGLRIELKRRAGGTVSLAQKHWIAWLTSQGYLAVVCKGWEEARDRLVDYLSC
jgi:hypothetical protein